MEVIHAVAVTTRTNDCLLRVFDKFWNKIFFLTTNKPSVRFVGDK